MAQEDAWIIVLFAALVGALIGLFGVLPVVKMITGKIDLAYLISEKDGKASLSRFQFLIFTFVIAAGYFLMVLDQISQPGGLTSLPGVDNTVLYLIGISGGGYVLSKGIQTQQNGDKPKTGATTKPRIGA